MAMYSNFALLALASTAYAALDTADSLYFDNDYGTAGFRPGHSKPHHWGTSISSARTTLAPTYPHPAPTPYSQSLNTSCTESSSTRPGPLSPSKPPHYPVPLQPSMKSWPTAPYQSKPIPTGHHSNTTWIPHPPSEAASATTITRTWPVTSTCTIFQPTSSPVYSRHGMTYYSTSLTISYRTSTWLTSSTSVVAEPATYVPGPAPTVHGCPVYPVYSCAAPVTITHTVYAPMPAAPTHSYSSMTLPTVLPMPNPTHESSTGVVPSPQTDSENPSTPVASQQAPPAKPTKSLPHLSLPPYPTKSTQPAPWYPTGTGRSTIYPTGLHPTPAAQSYPTASAYPLPPPPIYHAPDSPAYQATTPDEEDEENQTWNSPSDVSSAQWQHRSRNSASQHRKPFQPPQRATASPYGGI